MNGRFRPFLRNILIVMSELEIVIPHTALEAAAAQGAGAFLQLFIDTYNEALGQELNAANLNMLNASQVSLLAYSIFRTEVMCGGFIQLIHNGYGPFIFDNPFAKAMRLMGAKDFSKLVYKGKELYDKYKEQLTADCDDEQFMALYEAYPEFDELDDEFVDAEEEVTAQLAHYVDEHITVFCTIQS